MEGDQSGREGVRQAGHARMIDQTGIRLSCLSMGNFQKNYKIFYFFINCLFFGSSPFKI
jgi:hypothetical protein